MEFFEPRINADAAPFWEGCRCHELRFQRCGKCGKIRWPASFLCPDCLSGETEMVVLPTEGVLYSYVVMQKPFHPDVADKVPYVVATVDLGNDVRILTNLVDADLDQIRCGDPVTIDFIDSASYTRPVARCRGGSK